MDTQIIQLCAYHESARVVYAYLLGYQCESIELSETDAGGGVSKLNGGRDNEVIQLILNGKPFPANSMINNTTIETAKNLMKIYCAGSCAEIFLKNNKQIIPLAEIEITGQDNKFIDRIQNFLQNNIPSHPSEYPSEIIAQIFREFTKGDTWKIIDILAQSVLNKEDKKVSRFYIEDALMKAGLKPARKQNISPIEMQIKEDTTSKNELKATDTTVEPDKNELLNKVLTDFLRIVKKDWTGEELSAAVVYLKNVFEQFRGIK